MTTKRLKIFFDGGCRPNPGPMETAVVACGVAYFADGIGNGSNSEAEWLALIHAAEVARGMGATDVALLGDSALVVAQANGRQPCRGIALRALAQRFAEVAAALPAFRIRRIKRQQNLAGIALEQRWRAGAPPRRTPESG